MLNETQLPFAFASQLTLIANPHSHLLPAGLCLLNAVCLQTNLVSSPELVSKALSSRLTCLTGMCLLLVSIS